MGVGIRRDLLSVLKAELEFLEQGGYRRASWRPQFIFQDSPRCLNFDLAEEQVGCSDCLLGPLIPEDSSERNFPCRYIPLNERGETIDSLYRYGSQEELETAVREWLRNAIQRLEEEKTGKTASANSTLRHICGKSESSP